LVPAWRAGLRVVISIPCQGPFATQVGSNGLLLTHDTRSDSDAYSAALKAFV
jgi:hypothetical protein